MRRCPVKQARQKAHLRLDCPGHHAQSAMHLDRHMVQCRLLVDLLQRHAPALTQQSRYGCRLLLDKKRQRHKNAQEALAALSFLEVEERTGRINLDVTEFRYVVSRFCELARLDAGEVPFLLPSRSEALALMQGSRGHMCVARDACS